MPADVQWILCDLGQTLVRFDHARAGENLLRFLKSDSTRVQKRPPTVEELFRFVFVAPPGKECRNAQIDRGDLDMPGFAAELREEFGIHITGRELGPIFSDIFSDVNEDVVKGMERARDRGINVALCSSTNPAHWRHIVETYPDLAEGWDALFLSFRMGKLKTDPDFFLSIAKETGAPAEAHLFLDDMQVNIDAARQAGMQAVRFEGTLPPHPAWD